MADGTVEVDWTPVDVETSAAAVVARMTDASNYLVAHYWSDSLWLYRVANGQYTWLGQAPVSDAGATTHHLAVKLAGAAIEVWWDGVQEIVASDAFNATATRHGFRWYSWWDSLCTYDRFEVSALPAIASVTVTPSSATIPMNGGRMFSAQALDGSGAPIPSVSFTWQSSNAAVLSVRTASATMGAAISEGVGSATLTAVAFGGGGQGSSSVTVSAPPPPPPPPPPPCLGGLFPSGTTWPADGGIGQITVSAPTNCGWSVDWNAPWITPLQTSGNGNTVVSYAVDRNDSGVTRSGVINVGGATFAIDQNTTFVGSDPSAPPPPPPPPGQSLSPPCNVTVTVEPWELAFGASGATGTLSVEAASNCYVSIVPKDDWVILERTDGSGNWATSIFVQPNQGTESRKTILDVGTIEGFAIPIPQAAAGGAAVHPYQTLIKVAGEVQGPDPGPPPGGNDPSTPHEPKATPTEPSGGGGEPTQVDRQFESASSCPMNAQQMINTIKGNFANFGDFTGAFGPLGAPLVYANAKFGNVPVALGAVIPIHSQMVPPNPGGVPRAYNVDVTVTVSEVTSTSFTFTTNPGHVLFPATITFSASDTASGLYFNIHVQGQFANIISNMMFLAGGDDLESKIWNHFLSQVHAKCEE